MLALFFSGWLALPLLLKQFVCVRRVMLCLYESLEEKDKCIIAGSNHPAMSLEMTNSVARIVEMFEKDQKIEYLQTCMRFFTLLCLLFMHTGTHTIKHLNATPHQPFVQNTQQRKEKNKQTHIQGSVSGQEATNSIPNPM